ncbi:MAG: biotin--[acetyl-CoA-carboxylase] ligase [Phycisphaerales bacterium]
MEDLSGWASAIEAELRAIGSPWLDRAAVLAETDSTQDAAARLAGRRPGLVVIAGRQARGRGRLGRDWFQRGDLGLAMTAVIEPSIPPERLSLAAGVAIALALEQLAPACGALGLRWPNDLVEATPRPGGGRKLGGILIEVQGGLALVGIGLNLNQRTEDFPGPLRPHAVSLASLALPQGAPAWPRLEVVLAVLRALSRALSLGPEAVVAAWSARDVLTGSEQTFIHDGREVRGRVERLAPTGHITLALPDGGTAELPALATSLKHAALSAGPE